MPGTKNRDDLDPKPPHKILATELVLRNLIMELEKINPDIVEAIAAGVNRDFAQITIDDPDEAEFIENMKAAAATILTQDIV